MAIPTMMFMILLFYLAAALAPVTSLCSAR
jgi:hypothetical protein